MNGRMLGALGLGLTLVALAAHPGGATAQEPSQKPITLAEATKPANRPVRLYVVNNNFLDVNVYALRGATRYRLGSVRSQSGEFIEVPVWATQAGLHVQLQAAPVGSSRTATTGLVPINPGDIVEWRIENNVNLSSFAIWSI